MMFFRVDFDIDGKIRHDLDGPYKYFIESPGAAVGSVVRRWGGQDVAYS